MITNFANFNATDQGENTLRSGSKITKQEVFINSLNRNSGVPENFKIQLPRTIDNIISVKLMSLQVPYSYFSTNNNYNTLAWAQTGSSQTNFVNITGGNYNASQMANALQGALNSTGPNNGFSVTFNSIQQNYTVSNTGGNFVLYSGTLGPYIGIPNSGVTSVNNTVTLPNVVNLTSPNYLMLQADSLISSASLPYQDSNVSSYFKRIPVNSEPGGVIEYNRDVDSEIFFDSKKKVNSMSLGLYDDQNKQINLNGLNWSSDWLFTIVG